MSSSAFSPSMPIVSIDTQGETLWFARDCRRAADLVARGVVATSLPGTATAVPAEELD